MTNLDFIEGSWKNSQESEEPRLIKLPTSVADKANSWRKKISMVSIIAYSCVNVYGRIHPWECVYVRFIPLHQME